MKVAPELKADVTAIFCRKCIQEWHEVDKGMELNEMEIEYVVALIMGWIKRQINEKGD